MSKESIRHPRASGNHSSYQNHGSGRCKERADWAASSYWDYSKEFITLPRELFVLCLYLSRTYSYAVRVQLVLGWYEQGTADQIWALPQIPDSYILALISRVVETVCSSAKIEMIYLVSTIGLTIAPVIYSKDPYLHFV